MDHVLWYTCVIKLLYTDNIFNSGLLELNFQLRNIVNAGKDSKRMYTEQIVYTLESTKKPHDRYISCNGYFSSKSGEPSFELLGVC